MKKRVVLNNTAFRNLIFANISNKFNLDTYDIEIVHEYLSKISCTKHTAIALAVDYHVYKITKLLNAKVTETKVENINQYQLVSLTANDKPASLVKKYSEIKLLKPTAAIDLEMLFTLEIDNVFSLAADIAPQSKLKYSYIFLDTDRTYETIDDNIFKWLVNDGPPQRIKGYLNVYNKLSNIKMVRLGQCVFIDLPPIIIDTFKSKRRIAFNFDEFSAQSILAPDGSKFQFLANYKTKLNNDSFILSTYEQNHGWFRFSKKINKLDTLTLRISDLFDTVPSLISLPTNYQITFLAYVYLDDTYYIQELEAPKLGPIYDNYYIYVENYENYINIPLITDLSPSDDGYPIYLTDMQYTISGMHTLNDTQDTQFLADFNSTHKLRLIGTDKTLGVISPTPIAYFSFPIDPSNYTPYPTFLTYLTGPPWGVDEVLYNVTLTITYTINSRCTTVLELISED